MPSDAVSNSATNRTNELNTHLRQMSSTRASHGREFQKVVKKNEDQLENLKDDYEVKLVREKTDLEKRLSDIRSKHNEYYRSEKTRLEAAVAALKSAHEDKVMELKASQKNQIDELNKSHVKTIAQAEEKFAQEKAKLQV